VQQNQFTVHVSDRSIRRVQIAMAAVQASEQTAQAAASAAQNMLDQARKSLDEALGAICDAHNEMLPEQYTLTIRPNDGTLTITDVNSTPEPMVLGLEEPTLNGKDHGLEIVPQESPS
jgi:hypothetical protein